MNDPTVAHTCPLKSPHCNLLTVFREMITVSVHAWKDTVVWWSFLHDAQSNQNSHMQNKTAECCLTNVWRRTCRPDTSSIIFYYFFIFPRLHRVSFRLLSRKIITCQRREPGHASSPGPDPAGTEQLINTPRGNWRGWDCHATFLQCPHSTFSAVKSVLPLWRGINLMLVPWCFVFIFLLFFF